MKKDNSIKYLRVGSKLINKHNGKICRIIERIEDGFRILQDGDALPTWELKRNMRLYFKKVK